MLLELFPLPPSMLFPENLDVDKNQTLTILLENICAF